jgi:hypothetical protein
MATRVGRDGAPAARVGKDGARVGRDGEGRRIGRRPEWGGWRVGGDVDLGNEIKGKKKIIIIDRWDPQKVYKQTQNRYDRAPLCHVSTDSGPHQSEIMLSWLKTRTSAHWNEFAQNRWFLCNFAE